MELDDKKILMIMMGIVTVGVIGLIGIFLINRIFKAWRRAEKSEFAHHRGEPGTGPSPDSTNIWEESGKRFTGSDQEEPEESEEDSRPFEDDDPDDLDDEADDPFNRR